MWFNRAQDGEEEEEQQHYLWEDLPLKEGIVSFNCRSLNANGHKIREEIAKKSAIDQPDFLLLQELWRVLDFNKQIIGYQKLISSLRKDKNGGGVGVFVKSGFNYKKVDEISKIDKDLEACYVHITEQNLILGSIYRPPKGDIKGFLKKFTQHIDHINQKFCKAQVVIGGDFNIDLAGESNSKAAFIECLQNLEIQQTIFNNTRVTIDSRTTIDNILINSKVKYKFAGTTDPEVSDHLATFIILKGKQRREVEKTERKTTFDLSKIEELTKVLKNEDWSRLSHCKEPCKEFYNIIVSNMECFKKELLNEK